MLSLVLTKAGGTRNGRQPDKHGKYNRAAAEILAMICDDNYVELLKKHDRNKDKELYKNELNYCSEVKW